MIKFVHLPGQLDTIRIVLDFGFKVLIELALQLGILADFENHLRPIAVFLVCGVPCPHSSTVLRGAPTF